MSRRSSILLFLAAGLGQTIGQSAPIHRGDAIFEPVIARHGMVVTAEEHASRAGLEVLREGGNAVDAGVCVGFTLAVTLPRAGNIGGGGFMIIHDATSESTHALDYRETAPMAASRDMFLDKSGNADPRKSRTSPLAVGVPGTVAGLLEAHEKFGTLPLARLLAPAIQLAEEGFPVSRELESQLATAMTSGRLNTAAKKAYSHPDGSPLREGDVWRQKNLAESLRRIASSGKSGFYQGPTATAIVETIQSGGGVLSMDDLLHYKPVWREPISGTFRNCTVLSMPPPSSGGVHLVQMLQILENFPLSQWGQNSQKTVHLMTEVMKHAYADRSRFLGDPDFVEIPVRALLSESHEQSIIGKIDMDVPTPSIEVHPGILPERTESPQTTHFSIVDAQGNAVSNTYTLNFSFGSGIMAGKAGILLNNEMDDFSAKPGTANAYGLIGGEANAVEPGKRMLSSMTPTIVLKEGKVFMVTGSPGGSRIITTVLQVLLNVAEFGMNASEANCTPRFHHQWLPDNLFLERGFPSDTARLLREMGHPVTPGKTIGCSQTIVIEDKAITGSTDPRRRGGSAVGY